MQLETHCTSSAEARGITLAGGAPHLIQVAAEVPPSQHPHQAAGPSWPSNQAPSLDAAAGGHYTVAQGSSHAHALPRRLRPTRRRAGRAPRPARRLWRRSITLHRSSTGGGWKRGLAGQVGTSVPGPPAGPLLLSLRAQQQRPAPSSPQARPGRAAGACRPPSLRRSRSVHGPDKVVDEVLTVAGLAALDVVQALLVDAALQAQVAGQGGAISTQAGGGR